MSWEQFLRNEQYYRNLLIEIGQNFPEAYIADDGSKSDEVLVAKLPEIVKNKLYMNTLVRKDSELYA